MENTEDTDKCYLCETVENVTNFCVNCHEILCSNCALLHSKNRKTKNDKVILLSQARHDDLVHKSAAVYCSEHRTVEITLFCLKCDTIICTKCLIRKHYGHNIEELDKLRDSKTEDLNKVIQALQEKKTLYDKMFQTDGQVHKEFLQSLNRAEKVIADQKTKIIEELNAVCEEQLSELSKIRKDEEKRYYDVCNKYQAQSQTVTSTIQTAQNSLVNNNTALIIQATVATTDTLLGLEDPNVPPTTKAMYQPGDRSRPTILRVQGQVTFEKTTAAYRSDVKCHSNLHQVQGKVTFENTTAGYRTDDRSNPTIHQVQGEMNTDQEAGAKPKLMADVQKIRLQEQMRCSSIKQNQVQDDNKSKIDINNVRIVSTMKVFLEKRAIQAIVPLKNETAWVKFAGVKQLSKIDSRGKIITKSASLDDDIFDVKEYKDGLLITCSNECKVFKMSANGKSKSTFSNLSPYKTRGLCPTQDMEVLVCLQSVKDNNNKIVRLNTAGDVIQTIQHDVTGVPLFDDPWSLTSLPTGEIVVVDGERILGVDRKGAHLFTSKGEIQGRKLDELSDKRITHGNNNLFVTDFSNNRVCVLGKDGSGVRCLLDNTQGLESPWGIAADHKGQLWVGCKYGKIHIIEY